MTVLVVPGSVTEWTHPAHVSCSPVPLTCPAQAFGKALGGELPQVAGGTGRVLYPASAKASDELQNSLVASGFQVDRLNTYNTVRDSGQRVVGGLGLGLPGSDTSTALCTACTSNPQTLCFSAFWPGCCRAGLPANCAPF